MLETQLFLWVSCQDFVASYSKFCQTLVWMNSSLKTRFQNIFQIPEPRVFLLRFGFMVNLVGQDITKCVYSTISSLLQSTVVLSHSINHFR